MTAPESSDLEYDKRRIRIGLALLAIAVFGSLAGLYVLESGVAKSVMLVIFLFTVVRAFLLMRSIRRDQKRA